MTDADNTQFAIETLEKGADLWKEVDTLMTDAWMRFPDHVRKRLQETGAADKFDALAKANKLAQVAAEARKLPRDATPSTVV